MNHRFFPALLVAALVLPVSAIAQDDTPGDLAEIITWRVDPDQGDAWEDAIKKIVSAAEAANLPGDRRWAFYTESPTRYTLVFPVSGFGYFDDPQQWMRSFEGTAGETMLQEAFAEMQHINAEIVSDRLNEEVEGWTHIPDRPDAMAHSVAHVSIFDIRPGQDEAFDAAAKAFTQFAGEIGYPYAVVGHKVHFGGGHKANVVTFVDDLASYYGENTFAMVAAAAGQEARLEELFAQLAPTISDWQSFDARFRPDLSYWPEEDVASN